MAQSPVVECTPLSKEAAPTHLSLATLHRELNTYAASIESARGGGQHGHLALVMNDADYLAIANEAFVAPVHPGPNPVPGNTQPQIIENNRLHAAALLEHKTYKDTENQLKSMLIKAVPNIYIEELQDPVLGYATVTTRQLLQHLDDNYGTVTARDLARNMDQMTKQWTGDQPIENLWIQIQRAKIYAAQHDPITDKTAIRAAVTNLQATGLFSDDIKAWENKPIAEQTWVALKQHFNQANNHRLQNPTVADVGFTAKESTGNNQGEKENTATRNRAGEPLTNWKYCWTHGLNKTHPSKNCKYPSQGHVLTATLDDRQNGSLSIYAGGNNRRGRRPLQPTPPVEA
jgi:hypothetical protein